jgi:ABC-2 type transport system ATP-binding protein
LSTHILPEATAVCQRVVIISSGRIVAEDTPDRLSTRLRHSEKIALTLTRAPADVEAQLRQVDGVLQVHANGPAGHFLLETQLGKDVRENLARLIVTSNWGLVELKLISMTLEDVFLKLTRHEEGLSQNTGPATAPAGDVSRKGMDVPS